MVQIQPYRNAPTAGNPTDAVGGWFIRNLPQRKKNPFLVTYFTELTRLVWTLTDPCASFLAETTGLLPVFYFRESVLSAHRIKDASPQPRLTSIDS
jgi:hypothetical protein